MITSVKDLVSEAIEIYEEQRANGCTPQQAADYAAEMIEQAIQLAAGPRPLNLPGRPQQ
jgi:hypothetical protein